MSRRKKSSEEGLNLDSLMDALTNVVAVLILVLLLVQADVTQKIIKFAEEIEPATEEQVKASEQLLAEILAKKESIEKKLKDEPPTPEKIEEEKRNIFLLEQSLKEVQIQLVDMEELKKRRDQIQRTKEKETLENTEIQQVIATLEAQLDDTPILETPPPAVVTIPMSRPIPENAKIYQALVIKSRVHMIDTYTFLESFEAELKKNKKEWELERIKQMGKDKVIYDPEKVAKHFGSFTFENPWNQKVAILSNPLWNFKQMNIQPNLENGGTPLDTLEKPGTEFAKFASKIKADKNAVIFFYVNSDSFSTYLKARSLVDKIEIAAGWEIWDGKDYTFKIPDFQVKQLQTPPPPPPNKTPTPPAPPTIGPQLD